MKRGWRTLLLAGLTLSAAPLSPAAHLIDLGPMYAAAVARAVEGARARLSEPQCRQVFSDFHDADGVPLQARLDAMRLDASDYLARIVFTDGFAHRYCRSGDALALTAPGSRIVHVCGPRFLKAQARRAADTEIVILHEALHTLGLGENPPDSLSITRQVARRCTAGP